MEPYFSLWDVQSGNLIDDFTEGDTALRLTAALIVRYGEDYAGRIELSWTSPQDETQLIASGPALVALVLGLDTRRPRPRRLSPIYRRRHVIRNEQWEPVAS